MNETLTNKAWIVVRTCNLHGLKWFYILAKRVETKLSRINAYDLYKVIHTCLYKHNPKEFL